MLLGINKDNFTSSLSKLGGETPDDSILDLLTKIGNSKLTNIKDYLVTYFKEFLNNRVGTYLTKDEFSIVSLIPNFNFKKGELVIYQERYKEFKWAIYLEDVGQKKKKIIIGPNQNEIEVFSYSLFKFPESEVIKQNYTNGINLDSNFTIETYNFN